MKRKLLIIAFAILFSNELLSQTKKSKDKIPESSVQPEKEIDSDIYKQAMKYGDPGVAINSLYSLIAKNPGNSGYKDSLARIYFQFGSYNQCLHVCEDINTSRSNDSTILRMMALCNQSLGHPAEAITELEAVVKITGNVYDLYQKASIEFGIKRLQESKMSIEVVLSKVKEEDRITLFYDKDKKQEVPLKAAAFNLYGMIAKEFNDTASARLLFLKAVKFSPEFYLANANLNALNELAMKNAEEVAPVNNNKQANSDKRK